nr:PR domain zinc finger protein 1 [Ciona intestinalis]|eukprot:XP_026690410.1 PR domain zinc finger protein 1 [Ciona intestinalis]
MLRSHPPPLIHAADLFHLRGSITPSESGDDYFFQKGLTASSPPRDDEDQQQDHRSGYESPKLESQDHPLNLSCRNKRIKFDSDHKDFAFNDWTTGTHCEKKQASDPAPLFARSAQQEEAERAVLLYRAQMMASSDFIRAILKRKWEEEMALKAFQQQVEEKSKSVPFAVKHLMNHQFNYLPYNMLNYASHLALRGSSSPRVFTNPMHPSSSVTIPSPPNSPSKEFDTKPAAKINLISDRYPKVICDSPPSLIKENFDTPPFDSSVSPTISLPEMPLDKKKRKKEKSRVRASSSNAEMYHCTICTASYPHKFELNRHVKVSHVRPHRCTQCGKGFGHRNYLKVHIETVHMGRKTHQCRLCGKYLSTGGNLNVHVRTIHLGEKKYNCPICSRSFGQQCNMKTHMKRHFSKSDDI